jgi:hypothetical protein
LLAYQNQNYRDWEDDKIAQFLNKTIKFINPKIIIKTDTIALEGLKAIEYYQFTLKKTLRKFSNRNKYLLAPLSHQKFASYIFTTARNRIN